MEDRSEEKLVECIECIHYTDDPYFEEGHPPETGWCKISGEEIPWDKTSTCINYDGDRRNLYKDLIEKEGSSQ